MGESGELGRPLLSEGENEDHVDIVIDNAEVRENGRPNGHHENSDERKRGGDVVDQASQDRLECAISILGEVPAFNRRMPIDPFKNKTLEISGLYEWLKIVILFPVLLVRILLLLVVLLFGAIFTISAVVSYKGEDPLPRWRRYVMFGTRMCGRGIMFCFGFHWIHRIGRPAPREVAPIVVSNHVSFIDPIFYFWELLPVFVSSTSHDDMFGVGTIIRAMQVIIVDRLSPESRRNAAEAIRRKALNNECPRVLLFPEGTTSNGRAVISFKLGAFRPGLAVQPVVVRYPFIHMDSSWGDIGVMKLMFRMFTQVNNFMEVEYLPVVYPTKKDMESAEAFAGKVRFVMATALNVPETDHTYGDLILAVRSKELKLYPPTMTMVEMSRMEKLFHLTRAEVQEYFDKFVKMDTALSGYVTMDQFLEALDLPKCPMSEKIFLIFDKSEVGYINFREFVAVIGFLSNHDEFSRLIKSSFENCDAHDNGVLSRSDLESSLRSVFPEISLHQVQQMFRKLDMDQDGVVSWEEFRTFLEKNPEFLTVFIAAIC